MEIKHNLHTRHFRLYNYLKTRGDQWTTQHQIICDLKEFYGEIDCENFHDSSVRHQLTKDIREINASDYLPKPILSGGRGVKLANKEEFDEYISNNISSVLNRLKRLKKLAQKGGRNGQYRLKLSEHQKEVIDAFLE